MKRKVIVTALAASIITIGGITFAVSRSNIPEDQALNATAQQEAVDQTNPVVETEKSEETVTQSQPIPQSSATPEPIAEPEQPTLLEQAQQIVYAEADRKGLDRETQWTCVQREFDKYPNSDYLSIAGKFKVYKYHIISGICKTRGYTI